MTQTYSADQFSAPIFEAMRDRMSKWQGVFGDEEWSVVSAALRTAARVMEPGIIEKVAASASPTDLRLHGRFDIAKAIRAALTKPD